ncbi:Mitochondrial distribution and morphology protein 12 [Mycena indigotica]|uniref:Mitochondrial distribution and morphology protein 12 n=1 Tax=Mycena indigotica TaxID=2126181 RepID=A0A8H6SD02_9AGAR|nr:Mitochondrial distribution and morphology protein 12 [Mycena indigotica]KAF7295615.1 Mitochondrial distribution and morphology protein 12 [Mycena indigotica]
MSIDLDWDKLDDSLAHSLVDLLNRQLKSTPRPSFIGPVEVTSLDFGSAAPDVELVDLRDIHRDFLEDDDSESGGEPVKVTEGGDDDDGFEWVSRRAANHGDALGYHHLPPHVRPGGVDMFASTPSLRTTPDIWNGGMNSLPSLGPVYSAWPNSPMYRSPLAPPMATPPLQRPPSRSSSLDSPSPSAAPPPPNPSSPNLQLHLHMHWPSDLRITLTTSLLINYPSPMFMSLPIKLSVTGLVFTGEVAVAYEGERKRVHLCILDDMDPYGPSAGVHRPKRDSLDSNSTPPDVGEADSFESAYPRTNNKPLPIGQRLLPSIYIESEIGQADKHVLKNVTRVERFIQDVIRKTVEEELVFPNFHTLVMGES